MTLRSLWGIKIQELAMSLLSNLEWDAGGCFEWKMKSIAKFAPHKFASTLPFWGLFSGSDIFAAKCYGGAEQSITRCMHEDCAQGPDCSSTSILFCASFLSAALGKWRKLPLPVLRHVWSGKRSRFTSTCQRSFCCCVDESPEALWLCTELVLFRNLENRLFPVASSTCASLTVPCERFWSVHLLLTGVWLSWGDWAVDRTLKYN